MEIESKIQKYLNKLVSKRLNNSLLQISIHSEKNNINLKESNIDPDKPFHIASVGKMFTATLVGILADKGTLKIDDKISTHLPKDMLDGLFTYEGQDYQQAVTIRDLLGHTSGIADYFESDVHAGSKFVDMILDQPQKKWSPRELIEFTRKYQKTLGPPGEFNYSDTGYVLLGFLIEKVTRKTFDQALEEMILKPLNMASTYLMFYKNTDKEIAPIWFNDVEISKLNMLSCDWAGGGIVSTLDDLLKFQKAYWKGGLVSAGYIESMSTITSKFRSGMHYGLGMMELRFEEFFFLLRSLPRPLGHSGILGTFMFYDKAHDTHIILNLGSNKKMPDGIKILIKIESILKNL